MGAEHQHRGLRAFAFFFREAVVLLVTSITSLGCQPSGDKRVAPSAWPKANVIVVSIDTLRADHLGAYGYQRPTSPNLDRFARDNVLFRRAVAPAPTTLPSHTSLFTGLFPHSHGVLESEGHRAQKQLLTLAELLRESGYATASFNDGGYVSAAFGLGQGFDTIDSVNGGSVRCSRLGNRVDKALSWLDEDKPESFFLFVHSFEVHIPYCPPDAYRRLLVDASYDGPLGESISLKNWKDRGKYSSTPRDVRHWIEMYDATIRSADAAFGKLIDGLRERGLYDDAIIVVVSDHGEQLGERGLLSAHGPDLFDEVLLVPMILKYPGGAFAGNAVDQQVRLVDLFPTITEGLGIEADARVDGRSLTPLARGERDGSRPSLSLIGREQLVFRTPDWKLYLRGPDVELYDLRADPTESANVAAAHPDTVARLRGKLNHRLGDFGPDKVADRREGESATGAAALPSEDLDETTKERLRALGYLE